LGAALPHFAFARKAAASAFHNTGMLAFQACEQAGKQAGGKESKQSNKQTNMTE